MRMDAAKLPVSPQDDIMPEEDDNNLTFPDDDEELPVTTADTSGGMPNLSLSVSHDDASGVARIGGLDESNTEESREEQPRRRKRSEGVRRARKRRKIVIDDRTELLGSEIKSSLQDTSDIVKNDILHPATWAPGQEPVSFKQTDEELLFSHLSYEKLFTRPAAGDDGRLAPELLRLWARNTAPILGKPFPYAMRMEEDVEDVEVPRLQRDSDEIEQDVPMEDVDDMAPPLDEEEEPPVPLDDDDARHAAFDDEVPPVGGFGDVLDKSKCGFGSGHSF